MFTTKNLLLLITKHALIALSVILGCLIVIVYFSREIESVTDAVTQNRKLAATLSERTTHLTQLTKDAEIVGTNAERISASFVPSDNVAEFIAALESIGQKNGIQQTFKFESPNPAAIASTFPMQTVAYSDIVTSNLPTFITFMKDFEDLPYFTRVDTLSISASGAQGLQGPSSSSFHATLFTHGAQ